MNLGESLVGAGLVQPADIDAALAHQAQEGGTLGQSLIALGLLSQEQLDNFFRAPPPTLYSIADTGLRPAMLHGLILKGMSMLGLESASALANEIKLPAPLVALIVRSLQERGQVESLGGATSAAGADIRFSLTARGREAAAAALEQSEYIGPAPVTLEAYQDQVARQRITNDRIDSRAIAESLAKLVLPEGIVDRLGPAVNSGRALLLYGGPGNGKTSIALGIAQSFRQPIYVPYCFEVDGQIIKVFDPSIHREVEDDVAEVEETTKPGQRMRIRLGGIDRRWMRCRRPVSVVGGELTLDMLELGFNSLGKFYEAPFHIKANGGIFVIDDFGRQIDRPEKILNRWTLPLESRTDYLTLATGRKFGVRFDGLVIFSTNLPPGQIMDGAMMRRIPYNFLIDVPTKDEYREILTRAGQEYGLEVPPGLADMLFAEVYDEDRIEFARYHPRFIVEHVIARCRFLGRRPALERELVLEATGHLAIRG
jgi:DNA-binding MarR family transcriptional regulator